MGVCVSLIEKSSSSSSSHSSSMSGSGLEYLEITSSIVLFFPIPSSVFPEKSLYDSFEKAKIICFILSSSRIAKMPFSGDRMTLNECPYGSPPNIL